MKNLILIPVYLLFFSAAVAKATTPLPIEGSWKITSYQIVGYPAMSEAETKNWIGKVVEFKGKTATLYEGSGHQVCPKLDYQVMKKNAEGYFLFGFSVEPQRLGVTEEEIELVRLTCQIDSWFGKYREFVKVSDDQILSYWDGAIFFLAKQSRTTNARSSSLFGPTTLLITPQSVGLLNPDSEFHEKNLKRAFPGYIVEKKAVTQMTNDGKRVISYFELYRQGQTMLEVYPKSATQKKAYIRIFDNTVQAPAQAKMGAIYADVFKNDEQLIDCQAGIKKRSGQTLCSFKNMSTIQYVFEPTSDKDISPIDALNQAQLVEIVWNADPTLITETAFTIRSPANIAPTTALTAQTEYNRQQKRLQELYNSIKMAFEKATPNRGTKNLNQPDELINFIKAQRAWTQYRKDHCHWHSALAKDDTTKSNKIFTCLLRMTRARVDEMEQILKQLEQ